MNARDELATTILHHPWLPGHEELYAGLCPECPGRKISGGHNSPSHADHLADALLAAGYRKPRVISAVEGMDAIHLLPEGSIIRDKVEVLTLLEDTNNCTLEWHDTWGTICTIQFPATVLYDPEAQS